MPIPTLKYLEYVVLGILMEGAVPGRSLRTILREEFGYKDADTKAFFHLIGTLDRAALIVIGKEVTTTARRTRQESCYEISDRGRSQWKYAYGFFQTLGNRWKEHADQVATVELPLERVYPSDQTRRTARLPNVQEVPMILAEAQPEFARLFNVSMITANCIIALSRVDVSEVDKRASTLRLQSRQSGDGNSCTIDIPQSCRRDIALAIAGRSRGPLFVSAMGAAWTAENIRMCWRRLKEKLNLDDGVVLPSYRFLKPPSS